MLVSSHNHSGCRNQFVKVEYNSATSTITCKFQNPFDKSEKSCSIQYSQCNEMLAGDILARNTSASDTVTLKVSLSGTGHLFCVIASNSTHAVAVEGRTGTLLCNNVCGLVTVHHIVVIGDGASSLITVAVAIIITIVFIIIMIMGVVCTMVLLIWSRHHNIKGPATYSSDEGTDMLRVKLLGVDLCIMQFLCQASKRLL